MLMGKNNTADARRGHAGQNSVSALQRNVFVDRAVMGDTMQNAKTIQMTRMGGAIFMVADIVCRTERGTNRVERDIQGIDSDYELFSFGY